MTQLQSDRLAVGTAEAARIIGFHQQTLKTWRGKGEGPACRKVGRRVIYIVADLTTWLESREEVVSRG